MSLEGITVWLAHRLSSASAVVTGTTMILFNKCRIAVSLSYTSVP
jgi:hypothetical protein